jgi:D-alanyl-D-alanine carboxypeptidase
MRRVCGILAVAAIAAAGLSACGTTPPYPYVGVVGPGAPRVTVSEYRDLTPEVQQAADAAARTAGGVAAVTHSGTLRVTGSYKWGGAPIWVAPDGYQWPVSFTAMEPWAGTAMLGQEAGDALARNHAVLSGTGAWLRGVSPGDVLRIRRFDGQGTHDVLVGALVPDWHAPAEVVMPLWLSLSIGFNRPSAVQILGFSSPAAIDQALWNYGLFRPGVNVRHSWDPPSPDSTLGLAANKVHLGEFWYRSLAAGNIAIDPGWFQANVQRVTFSHIPIRANCHRAVVPAIQGALTEIYWAGLAGAIDVGNTNAYGGCFAPREIRPAGGTTGGNLSRHSWAGAIDINPSYNAIGAVPTMDCRVVHIFRKWGFAWGGNFATPDGMHFEWVGENRANHWSSGGYCPNPVPRPASADAAIAAAQAIIDAAVSTTAAPTTLPPTTPPTTAPSTTVAPTTAAPTTTPTATTVTPSTSPSPTTGPSPPTSAAAVEPSAPPGPGP